MQNPKDIVPFWNKARQAMADISTLLEEAEKEVMEKLKPLVGKSSLSLPLASLDSFCRKQTYSMSAPKGKGIKGGGASTYILSSVDLNFGTLGQRIDFYFHAPTQCVMRQNELAQRKARSASSLSEEELSDLDILKKLNEGRVNSTEAYNQLDETEGLIVRVRVTPTIEEIESLVLSRGFTLTQEQNRLLWGVDSKLVYTCPLQQNE